MTKLHLASNLSLPSEAVTQTFGILAKRGVGKTYTASVMAEEMLKARLPIVVADPIGVWWGLRASADGKSTGLPIYVFGGESKARDLTLEVGAGELIADVIVDERLSVVLDLSLFRKGEQTTFMTAFSERLYHKNREALHLFIDEADAFAPQKPMKGQERLLGAMQDIVRRGRARGLGSTLITQRSAVLSKDVLTQIEVLVALRTISPQDRAAVDAWIEVHGTPEQREQMMASLPALPVGTAWFWSPGWPTETGIFKRVEVRARETYDSSSTPKSGERRVQPKHLAGVDLSALQKRMASTIEQTRANDPALLRKRVKDLEAQLSAKGRVTERIVAKVEKLEIPALKDAAITRLEQAAKALTKDADRLGRWEDGLRSVASEITTALGSFKQKRETTLERYEAMSKTPASIRDSSALMTQPPKGPRPVTTPTEGVTTSQQRILDAIAWLTSLGVEPASKVSVAAIAKQSPSGGGYANNLGKLRSGGLIDYPMPGMVALTPEGMKRGDHRAVASGESVLEMACSVVTTSQATILRAAARSYPEDIGKEELAALVGQSAGGGGFANNLGRLRSLGFIDYPRPGRVVALPVLFVDRAA